MSVYYYLVCDTHCQSVDVASVHASGNTGPAGNEGVTAAFCYAHRDCALRVTSENDEEVGYTYDDWHPDNYRVLARQIEGEKKDE